MKRHRSLPSISSTENRLSTNLSAILARALFVAVLLAVAWSIWAAAPATTNAPALESTNAHPDLVQRMQHLQEHPVTFKLDTVPFLTEHELLGEPLWKYVASLLYILLAFYFAKLIDVVTRVWLKRLATRAHTHTGEALLKLLRGPLKLVVFVVLLNVGLNLFDWSDKAKRFLSRGLTLVVAASLTYLAIKIEEVLLTVWQQRHAQESERKFNDDLFSVIRISLTTFTIIIALLVTAQNMDINISAAIASLSIGGLAVGLAAQDTLANLFGAVAVFVDKPFQVGDQIKLDGTEGTVEAVGLRSTRVRNPDGQLVAVPNKTMGNAIITNLSRRSSIKTILNFALPQDLPAAKVKEALAMLNEIYRAHPMTAEVWVSFNQFVDGKLKIQVVHWWKGTDYQKYLAGLQELNLRVKERFEQERITLA
jgi:MscS family membrane protein